MTVVRLATGGLLLHSPCRPSNELMKEIASIGKVAHVVAPNWFHDLYLNEYRALYRDAVFWAPALLQRQRRLIIDRVLDGAARPPWFDEMPHIALAGLLTFDECIFFHNGARTLIVTDLLMNPSVDDRMPTITRLGYWFFGLNGELKVFPILRWLSLGNRESLRQMVRQISEWNPDRLVVAHGTPVKDDVGEQLHVAFRWLGVT